MYYVFLLLNALIVSIPVCCRWLRFALLFPSSVAVLQRSLLPKDNAVAAAICTGEIEFTAFYLNVSVKRCFETGLENELVQLSTK